jgi:Bacterial protein of unknown function (Gcw_chp)
MKFDALTRNSIVAVALFAVCSAWTPAFAGETAPAKSVVPPVEEKKESPYKVSFTLGYDSQYIFRGVDITGDTGIAWGDVNFTAYGLNFGAWYAITPYGHNYKELDLYLSYTYDFGPIALTAGYIFYLFPEGSPPGTDIDGDGSPDRNTYTHEFNFGISSFAIPFITPSVFVYWDPNDDGDDIIDGVYLEGKIKSSIPIVKDVFSIDPYALVSYSFGYNSPTDDWNNFQAGLELPFHFAKYFTISATGSVSVPFDAISDFSDDYELWGGGKINFSF